jgi:predicted DNA-binding protein with PD1-like motif
VGTVCATGEFHLHLSVSKQCGSVVGGHLKGLSTVATTAEVVLAVMPDLVFNRLPDVNTG